MYTSNTEEWAYKAGCTIHLLRHLKEDLALAIDKWLQIISNIICTVLPPGVYEPLKVAKELTGCHYKLNP